MTQDCPLFHTAAALSSMYDESNELHSEINRAYSNTGDNGFYEIGHNRIEELYAILARMQPIIEALESKLREETKAWESLPS